MAGNEVAKLRFRGGIYDDCALDASALQVIVKFEEVLSHLAKAIYTSRHGKPQAYTASKLIVRQIEQGSTRISIETTEQSGDLNFKHVSEELQQATKLLYTTYEAAGKGDSLPATLPLDQVNTIVSVVDRLTEDSSLEFSIPGEIYKPITQRACRALRNWVDSSVLR